MTCTETDASIHAYVDGELAGIDREAFELHLLECNECSSAVRLQARFKAAVRGHLPPMPVPDALRARIRAELDTIPAPARRWPWHVYPRVVPALAAAAALVLIVWANRQRTSPLAEQALRSYNAAMPLDVTGSDCAKIANWFRGKVDFNLSPPRFDRRATCEGGRLVNVQDGNGARFGAYIVYQVNGGHRVAVLVSDGEDEPVVGPVRRVLEGRQVYYGTMRGATLAAYRDRDGLSYVMASDDEETLQDIVRTVFIERR